MTVIVNRFKMTIILLIFLVPESVIGLEFTKYQADYFFKDSIFAAQTNFSPALNALSCAVLCKDANGDRCPAMIPDLSELQNCQSLTNTQGLIKSHSASQNAVKIWSTAPINTVAHFMCFTDLYVFNDYSLDSLNSPIMTNSYPNFPSLKWPCGIFIASQRKLAIKSRASPQVYEWKHGEASVTQLSADKNDPVSNRAAAGCGYSATKFIMYSGGSSVPSAFVYDSGNTKSIPTPHGRRFACTAFHPLDDNVVYVFGGYINGKIGDHAFAFFLNTSEAQDIRVLNTAMAYIGCIGFIKKDDRPAVLLVGGLSPGVVQDTVWVYDIQSDTYDSAPNLPLKRYAANVVEKDDYIYSFGGTGASYNVLRIKKSLDANWEQLDDLVSWTAWNSGIILPYN